ncbi:hypothetical protein AC249_AIPGENE11836 [Exaiptasia diaphana]|nr:hypothetical protein AC249_AIPGENE11836 [Exaiptasia diaphana]
MKSQDRKAQKAQAILMGSINAGIKAANLAINKYVGDREVVKHLSDCVALPLQYNHEVNQGRRTSMKKELHKDYAAICNVHPAEDVFSIWMENTQRDSFSFSTDHSCAFPFGVGELLFCFESGVNLFNDCGLPFEPVVKVFQSRTAGLG